MIIIWKGPAFLILSLSGIASFLLTFGFAWYFKLNDQDSLGLGALLMAAGMLAADLTYRRRNYMKLFDLGSSTLFIILPTWLVGAILSLAGTLILLKP